MTVSILFWARILIYAIIAYSLYTAIRSLLRKKSPDKKTGINWKPLLSDAITIGFGVIALIVMERNFQQPFDKVLGNKNSSLFPAFEFNLAKTGEASSLEKSKGKLTIINYWATWCGPCRKELPALDSVQKKYAEKGLKILAISDENFQTVESFLTDKNFSFTIGTLTRSNNILEEIDTRPVSILLDENGKVLDMLVGSRGYSFFEGWVSETLK